MAIKPDTRLKIRRFFKKYGKIIAIILATWVGIIIINKLLGKINTNTEPSTTYQPHVSVLDENSSAPKKVQNAMEDFVKQYVEYCNNGEYENAYNMISEDCKNDNFSSFEYYKSYVSNKFTKNKKYTIQNYSNYNDKYIYTVKLYDDVLATGLTNSTYMYQEEKITASYDEKNNVVFSVGNFIEKQKIQSVQENEYLKVDIRSKTVEYSLESYEIKLTNRSENTIVIKNGRVNNEVLLNIGSEYRQEINNNEIILKPNESRTCYLIFNKFYDDGCTSKSIVLNSVRVVEQYIEDNSNEDNSIYKFSMELGL
ncbi:MAG: hypothetical protein ACI4UE_02880 [Candidatus Scatovivens sp.]